MERVGYKRKGDRAMAQRGKEFGKRVEVRIHCRKLDLHNL